MSQPVDKQQLKNILIPAAAVAAVIVLIGLVIGVGGGSSADTGKGKVAGPGGAPVSGSAEGMSTAVPPVDAAEWKPLGDRGLKTWDVKEGEGEPVKPGANVTIHYIGWLTDGTVFDSSVRRGEPAKFDLDGLIQAWQIGIPAMKPGGIRRLLVPPALGYGASGQGQIPPNATLIFEVKLLSSR